MRRNYLMDLVDEPTYYPCIFAATDRKGGIILRRFRSLIDPSELQGDERSHFVATMTREFGFTPKDLDPKAEIGIKVYATIEECKAEYDQLIAGTNAVPDPAGYPQGAN